MRLINILNKEINNTNNHSLQKLLLDEINNLNKCIRDYNDILNKYSGINEDIESYNEFIKQKKLINDLFEARKLISVDSDKYIEEINKIKKIIKKDFKNNEELNDLVNNNVNYKILFKLKNSKRFKSKYSYRKINKDIILKLQNDLNNIYFNILLIFKKYDLNIEELLNNNSIYNIINKYEVQINNINAKIELLNYANLNKDEAFKFTVLNSKNSYEDSNILKKMDENYSFTAEERSNQRRMVRKQECIMNRKNLNRK